MPAIGLGKGKGKGAKLVNPSKRLIPPVAVKQIEVKKKRRNKRKALKEVRKQQRSTEPCISFAGAKRMLKGLIKDSIDRKHAMGTFKKGVRVTPFAVHLFREAFQQDAINRCQSSQLAGIHRKRITIVAKDLQLAERIKQKN